MREFRYINYKQNIIEESINFKRANIYIFDNHSTMLRAKQYYNKNKKMLSKESKFLLKEELWDLLFVNDKTIIKEDKLNLIFYSILDSDDKKYFHIDNYFNSYDTASEFFHFYNFLQKNDIKVDKIKNNVKWQQERLDKFKSIRKRYLEKMSELGLIDEIMKRNFINFDMNYLKDYEEIYFVNILDFNNFDKRILTNFEQSNKKLNFILQINKNDFDENKLCIKDFTFPYDNNLDIGIYKVSDELIQLINLLVIINNDIKVNEVIDLDLSGSNYEKIITRDNIKFNKKISFQETKIYNFLKELYNIISAYSINDNNYFLEIKQLINSLYNKVVKEYYDLQEKNIKKLKKIAQNDYVYLDKETINKIDDNKLKNLFRDLKNIKQIKNIKNLIQLLKNINLDILKKNKYCNKDLEQYFDGLMELETIGDMDLDKSLNNKNEDIADLLFKLVLNYLKFKKINREYNGENLKAVFKDINSAEYINREYLIIINANQDNIPKEYETNTFLTERQLEELNLNLKEIDYLKQKYYFYRSIFNAKKTDIFHIENIDNNITGSSLIEELKIKYNLKSKKPLYKEKNLNQIFNQIFNATDDNDLTNLIDNNIKNEDKMLIASEDFKNNSLSINYYKYEALNRCYFKFYLEKVIMLEEEQFKADKELDMRMIGIIAHNIFERVINKCGLPFVNIDRAEIEKIVFDIVNDYNYKIHNYYKKYYKEILFEKIIDSLLNFNEEVNYQIKDIKRYDIEYGLKRSEIYKSDTGVKVYVSGRPDLVIETADNKYIIDFKTGNGNIEQLALYSLMINFKEQNYNNNIKSIYKVFDKSLKINQKEIELKLKEKIINELNNLFNSNEYTKQYKKSCKNCNYYDICKVVVK